MITVGSLILAIFVDELELLEGLDDVEVVARVSDNVLRSCMNDN